MKRRNFLLQSSLTAFSIAAFGTVTKGSNGTFTSDCETTNDILGPFYRQNAPKRSDLTFEELQGNRILIKGKLFKEDCKTIISGASVEIWHCNTKGEYDNDSGKFLHRASWITNEKGEYSFLTIIPGKYLNGGLYRPSHIHFRVTEKNHKELISQIYFKGDPHISTDPWASDNKARERILEIIPENIYGGLSINFDIYLKDK